MMMTHKYLSTAGNPERDGRPGEGPDPRSAVAGDGQGDAARTHQASQD